MNTNIKTFEDACKALSIPATLPIVDGLPVKHRLAIVANYKLFVIAQALNDGWEPNWNDYRDAKYYPWMKYSVGSGFSVYDCGYDSTHTTVGSRLCFKSEELAKYAGTQFKDLYNDLMAL